MALESSPALRSSTGPKLLLRASTSASLIALSAGAALLALAGYLYMRTKHLDKTKRKAKQLGKTVLSTDENSTIERREGETNKEIMNESVVDKNNNNREGKEVISGEDANKSEIKIGKDDDDLDKISHDLVRIVLNCATEKLKIDDLSLISSRLESSSSSSAPSTSGGSIDACDLDGRSVATPPPSLENDSSSSSSTNGDSNLITTTSTTTSPRLNSYAEEGEKLTQVNANQSLSTSTGNLMKSSSTTSTTSTLSSAAADACNQQQKQQQRQQAQPAQSNHATAAVTTIKQSQQQATVQSKPQQQQQKNNNIKQRNSHKAKSAHNTSLNTVSNKNSTSSMIKSESIAGTISASVTPKTVANTTATAVSPSQTNRSTNVNNGSGGSSLVSPEDIIVYEFTFPRKYCGKLIGKNGVHVDYIRSKTHTQIAVRDHTTEREQQIVCVSGRLEEVDQALDIISARFPLKHYPNVSFKPISKPIVYRRLSNSNSSPSIAPMTTATSTANTVASENPKHVLPFENDHIKKVLVAPNMFVDIKEAANQLVGVHVSAVVNVSHVFVQLPSNPTYELLQKLDECMLEVYGGNKARGSAPDDDEDEDEDDEEEDEKSKSTTTPPTMIEPIEYGAICVAPTSYGWHRAMVSEYMSVDEAKRLYGADYNEECGLATVKFLDYGGYLTIPANQLRQLRSDFMLLPFQAVECYLDGIYVYQGTEEEGKRFLTEIIKGTQLKISLCGYAEDGIPLIKLFLTNNIYQNVNLNSELVNYNYAFHIDPIQTDLLSEMNSPLELEQQQQKQQQQLNVKPGQQLKVVEAEKRCIEA